MMNKWPSGRAADMRAAITAQKPGDTFINDDGQECVVILAYSIKGDRHIDWVKALGMPHMDGNSKWVDGREPK